MDNAKHVRNLVLLGLVTLALWWLFMGDTPLDLVSRITASGRGKKLTVTHLDESGNLIESIDDVRAQVVAALGRDVAHDAVILARVSASEHDVAGAKEKSAIQWVCKNDAAEHGWSLEFTTTCNPGSWGIQSGRRYSTRGGGVLGSREIHEDDLQVAEGILSQAISDPTGGAAKFVHITGYHTLAAFLAGHSNVQSWIDEGLTPVFLGDVSTLVVFQSKGQS